jgi:hypothetical protein
MSKFTNLASQAMSGAGKGLQAMSANGGIVDTLLQDISAAFGGPKRDKQNTGPAEPEAKQQTKPVQPAAPAM